MREPTSSVFASSALFFLVSRLCLRRTGSSVFCFLDCDPFVCERDLFCFYLLDFHPFFSHGGFSCFRQGCLSPCDWMDSCFSFFLGSHLCFFRKDFSFSDLSQDFYLCSMTSFVWYLQDFRLSFVDQTDSFYETLRPHRAVFLFLPCLFQKDFYVWCLRHQNPLSPWIDFWSNLCDHWRNCSCFSVHTFLPRQSLCFCADSQKDFFCWCGGSFFRPLCSSNSSSQENLRNRSLCFFFCLFCRLHSWCQREMCACCHLVFFAHLHFSGWRLCSHFDCRNNCFWDCAQRTKLNPSGKYTENVQMAGGFNFSSWTKTKQNFFCRSHTVPGQVFETQPNDFFLKPSRFDCTVFFGYLDFLCSEVGVFPRDRRDLSFSMDGVPLDLGLSWLPSRPYRLLGWGCGLRKKNLLFQGKTMGCFPFNESERTHSFLSHNCFCNLVPPATKEKSGCL